MKLRYAVITAARNEAAYIGATIDSILAQSEQPLKWIVVNDGSSDTTGEIIHRAAAEHNWIVALDMPPRETRTFAGKVHAFNAGLERLAGVPYDVLVNLDGDVSFGEGYFEFLLSKLEAHKDLGMVGTAFMEEGRLAYDYLYVNIEHVSGPIQVFRKRCFEAIGGYRALEGGCVDHIAVIGARMAGWRTRTFTEQTYVHHRPMGTAGGGCLRARVRDGQKDYAIGNHPLWEVARTAYQMTKPPYIIGGLMIGLGFCWALLRGNPRSVSPDMMLFYRREQMDRLKRVAKRIGGE